MEQQKLLIDKETFLLAYGYAMTMPENSHKVMDATLAQSILKALVFN